MDKISILIPCYNGEKYLKDCIKSISIQTFQNYEILIVNDGSIDKSKNIINELIKSDKKISVINMKNNLGVNEAIKKGLKKIKNPYLCIVSVDDPIKSKNFFEININLLQQNPDCAFSFSNPGEFFEHNNLFKNLSHNLSDNILKITPKIYMDIMKERPFHISTNSIIHRTKYFKKTGFNSDLEELADWTFSIVSSLRYNSIYIPKNFVYTRIHYDSYSKIRLQNTFHHSKTINKVYLFLSKDDNKDILKDFIKIGVFPNYNLIFYLAFIFRLKNLRFISLNQIKIVLKKNLWYLVKILSTNTCQKYFRSFFLKKV